MKQTFWEKDSAPLQSSAFQNALDRRLDRYRRSISKMAVEIETPEALTAREIADLKDRVEDSNFAFYRCIEPAPVTPDDVLSLCHQVGLKRLDGSNGANAAELAQIRVTRSSLGQYIPYTNKELKWHTDGYYNPEKRRICGMLLHCVRAPLTGGKNSLIDHEIVYALLHQVDPAYVGALCRPDAMTIPANPEADNGVRKAQSGPVFWCSHGRLYMRYTARGRNILWRDDALTHEAVAALREILARRNDLVFSRRLKPGEGILSNNVLHRRDAFHDGPNLASTRLVYRGRFHDGVTPLSRHEPYCHQVQ